MKIKLALLLMVGAFSFISCNHDDETTPTPTSPTSSTATLNFTINGTSYSSTSFNNTLVSASQSGQSGNRMDIRGTFDSNKTLILSVSNWDWQNPPTNGVLVKKYDTQVSGPNADCQTISGTMYCDGALGTYMFGSDYHMTISQDAGYIEITSCDPTSKKVSGNFYFLASDISETVFDTIQGTFTNQVYIIP
ncbi:MAG: hypothetical protein CVU05_06640 [Bacteroidetes bacterium HGW-Bacteroidetes-21]|jgi:hypothetical protein|nr:MAG: hypothetical protein CVU05_06640 [Bacteroidetes bacterium HGW-Bacteroidetes-21]